MNNGKAKKFRQTRQLIKLALQDGWTQQKIAAKCRTQQSIVSAWARGEKYANENILKPLLEIYGSKIKRKSFGVYYSIDKDNKKFIYSKVEGTVIFSYTFTTFIDKENTTSSRVIKKEIPIAKIVVHHQGKSNFRVITQKRPSFSKDYLSCLQCNHSSGIWFSSISDNFNTIEVIDFIEKHIETLEESESEKITIPFLIRKALIDRGFELEGIEEYSATW